MRRLTRYELDRSEWGKPVADPSVAASEPTPITDAVTQVTQVANETDRVTLAVQQLPPPPYIAPVIGQDGRLTQAWLLWLQQLWRNRVGGSASASNDDLQLLAAFNQNEPPPAALDEILKGVFAHTTPQPQQQADIVLAVQAAQAAGQPFPFVQGLPRITVQPTPFVPPQVPASRVVRELFMQTADRTITNTAAEVSQFTTGIGSLIIPANTFRVGMTLWLEMRGYITTAPVGPTATLRVKLGGTVLITNVGALPGNLTQVAATVSVPITCRAVGTSGSFRGSGISTLMGGSGVATISGRSLIMTADATLDTSAPMAFDITYQFGTASTSNTLVVTNAEATLVYVR